MLNIHRKPVYVESVIATDMERLWEATQTPAHHQTWDLRFTSIDYVPRQDGDRVQRFRYTTKIGFGITVSGEGETSGHVMTESGARLSGLRFWSDQSISLIRNGGGYWKYTPIDEGIRFITKYDYTTRFGLAGAVVDRFAFRPLIGWATAWSFDCLRLWMENGVKPAHSIVRTLSHYIAVIVLASIWCYEGLVPKLLMRHPAELDMLSRLPLLQGMESTVLVMIGAMELIIGIACLILHRKRWIYGLNSCMLILLAAGAAWSEPSVYAAPFNPVALTLAMLGLCWIGSATREDLPSAARCARKPVDHRRKIRGAAEVQASQFEQGADIDGIDLPESVRG